MLFGFFWVMRSRWDMLLAQLWHNRAFRWALLFAIATAASVFWSENRSEAWRLFALKIPLFAWPLALAGVEPSYRFRVTTLLDVFVLGLSLSCVALLCMALYQSTVLGATDAFFYHNLMRWPMLPGHYFSLYLVFGAGWTLHRLLRDFKTASGGILALRTAALALFVLVISLTAVRIAALGLVAALLFALSDALPRRPRRNWGMVLSGIGVFGLLMLSPETRRRAVETWDEWKSFNRLETEKQTNARVYLWKHGWAVMQERPLFGHGLGDADDRLQAQLETETALFWDGSGHYRLSDRRFNYHNTFLQTAAQMGWLGLILLVCLFATLLHPRAGFAARLLGLVCLISFSTESMLERQAGVFFFGFMFALLAVELERTRRTAPAGVPPQTAPLFDGRAETP